ncbi:MAG TPA: spore germination protein [Candidatus Acidoferrum sp.]|nr:spore germination protein [Candidatus Acidoferrum sp.]
MSSDFISKTLSSNESTLKKIIGESFDIQCRHFKIPALNNSEAFVVYVSGLVDGRIIDETIIKPLILYPEGQSELTLHRKENRVSLLMEKGVFTAAAKETTRMGEAVSGVLEGDTALFIDECTAVLVLNTRKYEGRAVSEPVTESEIKGPRDGFVENIQTNAALIRRRIKDPGLRFDKMTIGARTQTTVCVSYIDGLTNDKLIGEVKQRLGRIKTDGVISSEEIQELIEDTPYSIFPGIHNTERPDKVCSALLEGRVVVLVDNTPFVSIIPAVYWEFFTSSGDYYSHFIYSSFIRWIRQLALFISISASSFYVMLTSYHQEMLPTVLAMKISADRAGVPFPAFLEAVIMELIIEIMKEAGLRLPKPIGQTVSIVGSLVIGQAAVAAGLVSPLLIIVIAVAAISSFSIPNFRMSNAFQLLRFPVLAATACFGLLGYLACVIVVLLRLMSMRSYGTPYLAPVIPFDKSGQKDVFVRAPWWKMDWRPRFLKAKEGRRQAPNLRPKPPPKG